MRIAVVGTIVADTIEADDGTVSESLGGIAHTVAALAAMAGGAHTIEPICRVGADSRDRIERWAAGLPSVSLSGTIPMREPNPSVRLSYAATEREGERVEQLSNCPPPLNERDVEAALGADAVVVNFITGSDLTPAAMRGLSAGCERVHLDVHSLALGTAADGTRDYRARDDWWQWLSAADTVQCNAAEAATICGIEVSAVAAEVESALAELLARELARRRRLAAWLLTLGSGGGVALTRRSAMTGRGTVPPADAPAAGSRHETVKIDTLREPAPRVPVVDPTGAGDAFGGGWVIGRLQGDSPADALRRAVRCGSLACTVAGVPPPEVFQKGLSSSI